jgi:hypothetical protein
VEVSPSSDQHAILTLEPGDEVVDSIKRAAMALGGPLVIVGAGEVEDVELNVVDARATGGRSPRKLRGALDLVSLTGYADGAELELRVVVAREGDGGSVVVGGLLTRATAVSVRVGVTGRIARARVVEDARPIAVAAPAPPPAPLQTGTAVPPKIGRASSQPDVYPEENDVVTHFHFGRCVVLSSDGERLKLQQERDGRVREVALSMLRIEPSTVLEDGRKHWDLSRKN